MGTTERAVVDTDLDRLIQHSWHPVALAAEVGEAPVGVTLLGQPVVVVRTLGPDSADGAVRAYSDVCVHRGAALSLGWRDGECLRCPFHGWAYDPNDGAVVEIPSQPDAAIPPRARLTALHCVEHIGLVWVALDEPVTPPPSFPAFDDDRFRTVVCPPYDWNCHASRRVENFLDFAHFAWVHPGTLGDRDHPEVPAHEVSVVDDVLHVVQPRPEPRNDSVKTGGLDDSVEHTDDGRVMSMMFYEAFAPLAAHLRQELPGGREYAVFLAASPIDDHTTRTFWHVARTYDLDEPDETFIRFQQEVVEQDRPIVESQRPEKIPPEVVAELHVRDDKVSLAWRRLISDLAGRVPNDG